MNRYTLSAWDLRSGPDAEIYTQTNRLRHIPRHKRLKATSQQVAFLVFAKRYWLRR